MSSEPVTSSQRIPVVFCVDIEPDDVQAIPPPSDGRRERHDAPVDANRLQTWNRRRRERDECSVSRPRDEEAERTAKSREDAALGQEVSRQAKARRPEGVSKRHLLVPPFTAHEKQVRDVRARDEENESDGGEKRQQIRPCISNEIIAHARDVRDERMLRVEIFGIETHRALRNSRRFRACLLVGLRDIDGQQDAHAEGMERPAMLLDDPGEALRRELMGRRPLVGAHTTFAESTTRVLDTFRAVRTV